MNDCWFVAAALALAAKRPGDIGTGANAPVRIVVNANGTYTVTFPGREAVTIDTPVNDGDNWGRSNGEWLAVLEKAYAWQQYQARSNHTRASRYRAYINMPGFPSTGIAIMTGNDVKTNLFSFTWDSTTSSNLTSAFNNNKIVTAVQWEDDVTTGMHVYAVTGWAGGRVTLRNPNSGGVRTMTLHLFTTRFTQIAYEE